MGDDAEGAFSSTASPVAAAATAKTLQEGTVALAPSVAEELQHTEGPAAAGTLGASTAVTKRLHDPPRTLSLAERIAALSSDWQDALMRLVEEAEAGGPAPPKAASRTWAMAAANAAA